MEVADEEHPLEDGAYLGELFANIQNDEEGLNLGKLHIFIYQNINLSCVRERNQKNLILSRFVRNFVWCYILGVQYLRVYHFGTSRLEGRPC